MQRSIFLTNYSKFRDSKCIFLQVCQYTLFTIIRKSDLARLKTIIATLISRPMIDQSSFSFIHYPVSLIDCVNEVATFLRLASILNLCVTKFVICNIYLVKVMFMHF